MRRASFISVVSALAIMLIMAFAMCSCSPSDAIRIATMPTEDTLPFWVAEQEGLFEKEGVDVEVVTFDSAQSLSAAISSGEADMAMTDIMRTIKLVESGTDVAIEWVALGDASSEGVFGVLAPEDAPYSTLEELAQYVSENDISADNGVGVAANTVPEYVFDTLVSEAHIPEGTIPTVEIASLPDRYGLVASGKLLGAALPASLLELGKANGMKVIADDSTGRNISQSVIIARTDFAEENMATLRAIGRAWTSAAKMIDDNPSDYAEILVSKANVNEEVIAEYPINTYPAATTLDAFDRPPADRVDSVITWMKHKGYIEGDVTYDAQTGTFSIEK